MAARGFLRDNGSAITISVTFAVIVIGAIIWMRLHLPPRTIGMATGGQTLAYWKFGERYRNELERDHVDVVVKETAGSLANLALLHKPDSGVSVALIQGGIINPKDSSDLESLGTVFYEPLWLFRKREVQGEGFDSLRGKKIAIGPDGSGTQALARELLKRHGIDETVSVLLPLPTAEAREKILAEEIDATLMVASWDAPDVQKLLGSKSVELSGYPQADTYADLYPYLHKVIVHRGVSDLANDRPPTEVVLIATKASLVVRKDLDPAIQSLLLKAAKQIHSGQTIFQRANEFPAAEAIGLPLSAAAQQFYKPDLPFFLKNFLNNYLPFWVPFWVAERINELVLFLLILVGGLSIFSPTMRPLGFLYDWTKRRKILRLYGELMFLEEELEALGGKNVAGKIAVQLDELEQQANRLKVPVAYASMLYTLRHHIELVRTRLEAYAGRMVK